MGYLLIPSVHCDKYNTIHNGGKTEMAGATWHERSSDSLGADRFLCHCDQCGQAKVQGLGVCRMTGKQQPQRCPRTQEVMRSTSGASQSVGCQEQGRNSLEGKLVSGGGLRLCVPTGQNSLSLAEI